MKPKKKAKSLPSISKARACETRKRLALYNAVEKAERTLYDAVAVARAARKFWRQAQEALVAAAGVPARERAEAVLDAARTFLKQSTAAVPTALQALDAARDELLDYEERRAKQAGEQSAADLEFLNRWAEAYNAQGKKKK